MERMRTDIAPFDLLSLLPPELLRLVAQHVLLSCAGARGALRLFQTCRSFCQKLQALKVEAETRRLRWKETGTHAFGPLPRLVDKGRTLVSAGKSNRDKCWAAGSTLCTSSGSSTWTVRVGPSGVDVCRTLVGVAWDAPREGGAASFSVWALNLGNGKASQLMEDPPEGWPRCHNVHAVKSSGGDDIFPSGRGSVVVQVHVGHGEGTLAFSVDSSPRHVVARGFPAGAQLRPWASIGHGFSAVDRGGVASCELCMVTFDPPYLH